MSVGAFSTFAFHYISNICCCRSKGNEILPYFFWPDSCNIDLKHLRVWEIENQLTQTSLMQFLVLLSVYLHWLNYPNTFPALSFILQEELQNEIKVLCGLLFWLHIDSLAWRPQWSTCWQAGDCYTLLSVPPFESAEVPVKSRTLLIPFGVEVFTQTRYEHWEIINV